MRIRAVAGWALVTTLCMFAGACNRNAIDPNLPAITVQPVNTTAAAGSTATFTVTATGEAPLSYQWFAFAQPIKGATSTSYTTSILAPSDNNSFYFVVVTNSIGSAESNEVLLTVTTTTSTAGANALGNANPADVLTQHNDAARTGLHLGETLLTPSSVNFAKFGKLGALTADGEIDAQPLYASGVTLPSGNVRNVLYAATEHGSVYAFDATSGAVIWQTGLLGANEQPADSGTCTTPPQERGITATPVIDRTRGPHGAIYVIANTKDSAGTIIQRIHALDIATGVGLFSGSTLIQTSASAANVPTSSAQQNFDAATYQTVAGLQLVNGKVFAAFGPSCSAPVDSGWVMGFDASSLLPTAPVYLAPASTGLNSGFTVSGLSADSTGNLYALGQMSTTTRVTDSTGRLAPASAGTAFLKLSTENGLALMGFSNGSFRSHAPPITVNVPESDSALILPDLPGSSGTVLHLALGTGNDGKIYLLNRDAIGNNPTQSSAISQIVSPAGASSDVSSVVAYFGNFVFQAVSGATIKAFALTDAALSTTTASQSNTALDASGAQISISASGANGGILWVVEDGAGILHAYDATNLSQELYNSTQAANSRDAFASAVSAVPPTVAGGRIYVATKNGIVVFGQLQ